MGARITPPYPITYFVSVALICSVLYLTKIVLSKMCTLHCLVPLNSVLFKPCLFRLLLLLLLLNHNYILC